jgi:hypothetical protein
MNRRNFLKICAAAIGGFFLARILGWLNFGEKHESELKEARFYKSGDELAG